MRTRVGRVLAAVVWTPAILFAGGAHGLSVGADVLLEPEIRCWAHGEHSTVFAAVAPAAPIARIYFRCSLHQDYDFTDLEPVGDRYSAVRPQATEDCPSVYHYVEAVSNDFTSSRTRERVAEVSEASECRGSAGDPRIILGATTALAPQMAPGFSAAGVVGRELSESEAFDPQGDESSRDVSRRQGRGVWIGNIRFHLDAGLCVRKPARARGRYRLARLQNCGPAARYARSARVRGGERGTRARGPGGC